MATQSNNDKTPSGNLWDKLLPTVQTDHGGINGADVIVLIVDAILLLYTGYRSWHFLDGTFAGTGTASEYAILAIIGLIGLDIGAVAWSLVWMFGSSTKWQDACAMTMFIVDVIGMTLTSMVDSLAGASAETPFLLKTAALYGVPAIILLNVIVGVVYHMVSPSTQLGRELRRMRAAMKRKSALAGIQYEENESQLTIAQKAIGQRQDMLTQQAKLADLARQLDALEHSVHQTLTDTDRQAPLTRKAESAPVADSAANDKAIADLTARINALTAQLAPGANGKDKEHADQSPKS